MRHATASMRNMSPTRKRKQRRGEQKSMAFVAASGERCRFTRKFRTQILTHGISLEAYIAKVRDDGSDELNPMSGIGWEKWEQIVTLPKSIGSLKSVKFLSLYGSHLVRIPPEICDMNNLEEFDPYTSRCLHWFPYEITRCKHLKRSRVSTRCLYGNYKYRPPFPRLPQNLGALAPATCSVCGGSFSQKGIHQAWISLRVATDVLPLLVHACSEKCMQSLPQPAFGYVQQPHFGGLDLKQPPDFFGLALS